MDLADDPQDWASGPSLGGGSAPLPANLSDIPAFAPPRRKQRIAAGARNQKGIAAVLAIGLLCAACASRPESGYLLPVETEAPGASDVTVLIASTRERDPRPGTMYNGERAAAIDYAMATVSIPPNHVAGAIEWAGAAPGDPNSNFVVRRESYLDGDAQFLRELNARLAMQPAGHRKALLFVHGYNTMFAEGLYRFAQVVHDAKSPAAPVYFTWASAGQLSQYVYDTNSATAARDALEHTIRLLVASNADQINILAHSMGNWVTVEALRQIKISERLPNASKLGLIVLAAPDIDVDVFKSQIRRFGQLKKPFYVILSRDDRALAVSNFIAGGAGRLGDYANSQELAAMGAVVIDLSDVKSEDSANHAKFAELAAVAPQLRATLSKGIRGDSDPADETRGVIGGGLGRIVTMPLVLLGAPIAIISR
jgi:esterase/lipase superfamily enzyme